MDYNREFKKINNEQKAYFLGFMYADGCISAIKRKSSTYIKYQVQISLTDEQIIKEFQENFPFFNLQIFDFSKYKSTWSKQFALRKANKQLFDDLLNQGMLERKSGENSKNLKLPNLDKSLWKHFIRGLFDGDGSISVYLKRPTQRRVEICSSSKDFLLEIKLLLEKYGINCPIFREKYNNKSPLYVLEWINYKDIVSFKNFLYENATIFLIRKKEKFDSFKLVNKKDNNPICVCGGPSVKNGKRQMKHGLMYRYNCTECNRKFSTLAQKKSDKLLENPEKDNQQPIISLNN